MKFCISFGIFELKYFFYCALFIILEILIDYFIYYKEEKIITEHNLMHSFCFFFGYLLNIIPTYISHIISKEKEKPLTNKLNEENNHSIEYIYNQPYEKYLSTKDIIKLLFICLIILLTDIIEDIGIIIENNIDDDTDNNTENNTNNNGYIDNKYNDYYISIEYFFIFLISKLLCKQVYYNHQYISFFILFLVGVLKNIYFYSRNLYHSFNAISIVLYIIYCFFYTIYYFYIKEFMKKKFISPYKCCFMIGIINVPIIIIIYLIISLTPLGNENSEYYFDNIFNFFKDIGKFGAKSVIKLIFLPIVYGIYHFIVIKTIYDYTIFHMYIPFLMQYFMENIIRNFNLFDTIFLISSFFIELIMIFIFLEIIEINFCGLNKNLKRNIELRSLTESSLSIENDDDDEIVDEKNDETTQL